MDINAQKQQMLQQEQQFKGMASAADYLDTQTDPNNPQKRTQALQALIPQFKQRGMPIPEGMPLSQVDAKLKQIQLQVNGTPEAPTKRTFSAGVNDKGQNLVTDRLYQGNKVIEESKPYVKKEIDRTAQVDAYNYEGKGARDKQLIDFEDATTASLNVMDTSTEVINAIRTSPESAGFSGNVLSVINDSVQTVSNLVSVMRPDSAGDSVKITDGKKSKIVKKSSIGDLYGDELSGFRNSAIWSQELDSMLVNLGYQAAMAKGQTGRGLSDMDLKLNMREVGKVTDNVGVERLIRKFTKRTISAYKNKAKVKGRLNSRYTEMVDVRMAEFDKLWDDSPNPGVQPSTSPVMQGGEPDFNAIADGIVNDL